MGVVGISGGVRAGAPWRVFVPRGRQWLVLGLYALAFLALHRLAALWGGPTFFSLWFPAAGLRLALLWRMGARATPAVMLAELAVQTATGVVDLAGPDWPTEAIGVVRPGLGYGLAVFGVRRLVSGTSSLSTPPIPFGITAVIAPLVAALLALPWSLLRPDFFGITGWRQIVLSLTGFVVGDLLGVLTVAPPLLWAAALGEGRARRLALPSVGQVVELVLVLAAAVALAIALAASGLRAPATPLIIANAWIGLRFGRGAAWAAITATAAILLPNSAGLADPDRRLALHMALASIAMVGYLAGSFADAQTRARADLARRDRLLFQAERLKTLRAMSVAVIHEISQPLSTLAIEARHLQALAAGADPEIADVALLIDRKAAALSTLVRRLRRFGGRAADEPSLLPLSSLLEMVEALARPEARATGATLAVDPVDPDLVVFGQEVELVQALVNLVRNALQACGTGTVRLAAERDGGDVVLAVANACTARATGGMGVGILIARAIVEAHGGRIERETRDAEMIHRIVLPLGQEPA